MNKIFCSLVAVCCCLLPAKSQEVVKLYNGVPPGNSRSTIEEKMTRAANGSIDVISDVTIPTLTAYLPASAKATGTSVVILPGGALRFLSWDMEGVKLAQWLNEKGVAAFVLKYRLRTSDMKQVTPPTGTPLRAAVYESNKLVNANANPLKDSVSAKVISMAAEDTRQAIRIIRKNATRWKINPDKVGCIGFSAGGGVMLSAVMHNADQSAMPGFIATIYGPALEDVVMPNSAPPLFIATCADHMNVAAGCLALFESWKRAGGEAEIHIYGKGKAGFGMIKQNQPSDEWVNSFYRWLLSEGF
ncbi:alpha/beta hydrolase [Paludibacter jiangxiensis]|uniref:Acetyl esterase n=1 Tax=Paludibacter jiangxiensis TaxID=681398 RepID=A0A170ZKC8_9BACT|nr:alpha/beta hydrolase [Paludibacter jiangxiensis]GAT62756.1 acetyl esterase [Paludibacter jiangxiensis]